MKYYTIIGGVNGVGKSSLTGVLKKQRTDMGMIIDTDMLNTKYNGDRIKGGKEAVRLINDCLSKGIDFTQETTLSGKKTLKTIIAAREKDYCIRLFYVAVSSSEESIRRIANRVAKGGHNISDDNVKRRYANRFDDLLAVLPYCNEAHFYDNENGFEEVGEYRNGDILFTSEAPPTWLKEIKHRLTE